MKKSVLTLLCAAHILLLSSCSFWLNPLLGLDGTGREDDSSGAVKTAKGELTSGSSVDVWSFDVSSSKYYYIWLNRNYYSATAQCELSYVAGYTYPTANSDNCYSGAADSSDDYSGYVYSKIGDGKIYIFVKPYGSYSTYAGKYSLSVTTDSTYSSLDRVKLTKVDTAGLKTNVYSDYTHGYIKSSEESERYRVYISSSGSYNLSIKDAGTDSDVFLLDVTADVSTTTSNGVNLSSGIDYYGSFPVSSSSSYIYITVKPKTKKSSGNFALKVTDSSGNSKSIYTY